MRPHFTSPEAMNWSITTWRAVGEIAELRFPDDEALGIRCRIAVLEPENAVFGQHRIDHFELRLVRLDVLERDPRAGVPLLAVLVVQHGVAVGKRAARNVLAGEPHADALVEQRRVGERLGHSPVERHPPFAHRPAVGDHALDARVQLEALRHFDDFLASAFSLSIGTVVSHGSVQLRPL